MQKELNKYDGGARKLVRHVIFPSKDRWSDKPQRLTCGAFNSIPQVCADFGTSEKGKNAQSLLQ